MRIAITGGPRTGKTRLANELWLDGSISAGVIHYPDERSPKIRHTDDLIAQCQHLGKEAWSEASRIASMWLDEPGPWIIEGVAVSRALRKWRDNHPGEPPPVDRVICCMTPFEERKAGQIAMARGIQTVHEEIEPWLREHGITTEWR